MTFLCDPVTAKLMNSVDVTEESLYSFLAFEHAEHSKVFKHNIFAKLHIFLPGLIVVHSTVFSVREAVLLLEI